MEQGRAKDAAQGYCLESAEHAVGGEPFERVPDQTEGDEFSLHPSHIGEEPHAKAVRLRCVPTVESSHRHEPVTLHASRTMSGRLVCRREVVRPLL